MIVQCEKFHVIPLRDLKPHRSSELCECVPKIELRENGWLIIHNSFDGREHFEVGKEGNC